MATVAAAWVYGSIWLLGREQLRGRAKDHVRWFLHIDPARRRGACVIAYASNSPLDRTPLHISAHWRGAFPWLTLSMFSETIELRGHIIDSLILPKVLDQILTHGAHFKIGEIMIGQKRADESFRAHRGLGGDKRRAG